MSVNRILDAGEQAAQAARDAKDAKAAELRAREERIYKVATIATEGIIRGAMGGNVTCIQTLQKLLPYLPPRTGGAKE